MNSSLQPRSTATTAELRREFKHADRDCDGRIDYAEFRQLLNGLEAGMSEQELHIGFREVDTDRDGRIDREEFIAWWNTD